VNEDIVVENDTFIFLNKDNKFFEFFARYNEHREPTLLFLSVQNTKESQNSLLLCCTPTERER
jgi:hypothetical protein